MLINVNKEPCVWNSIQHNLTKNAFFPQFVQYGKYFALHMASRKSP